MPIHEIALEIQAGVAHSESLLDLERHVLVLGGSLRRFQIRVLDANRWMPEHVDRSVASLLEEWQFVDETLIDLSSLADMYPDLVDTSEETLGVWNPRIQKLASSVKGALDGRRGSDLVRRLRELEDQLRRKQAAIRKALARAIKELDRNAAALLAANS